MVTKSWMVMNVWHPEVSVIFHHTSGGQKVKPFLSTQAPFRFLKKTQNTVTSHHAGKPRRESTHLFDSWQPMRCYDLVDIYSGWISNFRGKLTWKIPLNSQGKDGISSVLWTCHLDLAPLQMTRPIVFSPKIFIEGAILATLTTPVLMAWTRKTQRFSTSKLMSFISCNSIMQKPHVFPESPPSSHLFSNATHTQCFKFNHLFQLEVHHFCMGHILKSWGCHPPKSSSFPYKNEGFRTFQDSLLLFQQTKKPAWVLYTQRLGGTNMEQSVSQLEMTSFIFYESSKNKLFGKFHRSLFIRYM